MEEKSERGASLSPASNDKLRQDEAMENAYLAASFKYLSGAFLGVAHDMRGQLNNIVVNLELMKCTLDKTLKNHPDPITVEPAKYRDVSVRQVRQLDRTIQSLLEILDLTPGVAGTFNLGELLEEVHALVKTYARHLTMKLEWTPVTEVIQCKAARSAIKRALFQTVLTLINTSQKQGILTVVVVTIDDLHSIVRIRMEGGQFNKAFIEALSGKSTNDLQGSTLALHKAHEIFLKEGCDVKFTNEGSGVTVEIIFAHA